MTEMKVVHKTEKENVEEFIDKNKEVLEKQPSFFVRHKILIIVTLMLGAFSYLLWFHGIPYHWAMLPTYLNIFFTLGGIVLNKREQYIEREMWKRYVDKYGNKRGNIPAVTRMLHKKMMERGIKIEV